MITIDAKSGIPVYIQLKRELQLRILQGVYPPGSRLPTVRQLAVDLRINSNTVARSYSELEREGIISTRQGRGTFVCEPPEAAGGDAREAELEKLLAAFLRGAMALGFDGAQIVERVRDKVMQKAER